MRDFRDAKAMAQTLRTALAAKGVKISNSESLELIAQALGVRDWNTLSAAIRAEPEAPPKETPPKDPPPPQSVAEPPSRGGGGRFSSRLEETLHRTVAFANQRSHPYATTEHLLLALIDDADAAAVMSACNVDKEKLAADLAAHLDTQPQAADGGAAAAPTPAFNRVIQRAVIHVHASGRESVTGANVLVAIYSERESPAAALLSRQGMSRYDAVNFISHGIAKGGGTAAA
jgi:hypothetical protein